MDRALLQNEINVALKAQDKPRLSILRQVLGEVKIIEVDERREVSEADVDACLKRVLKQTRETLDGSIKTGTDDIRTQLLTQQVTILEDYLPQ
ncbi:MAG: GatB/YqeY domain-containing protein, partial [Coriobacteriales bacterium]|nr:GatB/YqeY domain-containing protein [Coriobacteriales bacterium]